MRAPAHIATATSVGVITSLMLNPITLSRATDYQVNYGVATHQVADTQTDHSKSTVHKKKPVKVTVHAGDSLAHIAKAHHTTWVRLFNANKSISDPNLIHPGQKLVIPHKGDKLPNRYKKLTTSQIATMPTLSASQIAQGSYSGTRGGPNKYVPGTCTWYVKNMRPDIGGMWGNGGYNWIYEAEAAGFTTSRVPAVHAVAVEAGHVALVDSVNYDKPNKPNKRKIISVTISEMNYAGYSGVHHRTVSPNTFRYIY